MTSLNEEYFKKLSPEDDLNIELAKSVTQAKTATTKKIEDDFESESEGQLTVDVYQTSSEIVVESAVAGIDPDDLDINVTNDSISIKGRRRKEKEVKDEDYLYQECYWGKFSRSVILPQEVDPDKASVTFKNGILTVRLPKLEKRKSKKLKVKSE